MPPPVVQAMLAGALRYHHAGRHGEAERLYRDILAIVPRHGDSLHLLGLLAYQTGRLDLASGLITKAIATDTKVASYHLNLGNVHLARNRLSRAVASYRTALKLAPDNPETHYNLGNALRALGAFDEAKTSYRAAIALKSDYLKAHYNLGGTLRDHGQREEAIACCRTVCDLAPDVPAAHFNLATILQESGRLDEAIACYHTAIDLHPDYPEAHSNLAAALKDQGLFGQSIDHCRRAIVLNPALLQAHTNLGNAFEAQGRTHEAIACYRQALALNPDDPDALGNLGNALMALGHLADAVACYRSALAQRPDFADAHYNLGNALRDQGLTGEAIICFQRAIELRPDFAAAHNNLANALKEAGRLDDAVVRFHILLTLTPDSPDAHNNLGSVLEMQRRLDEAEACYRRTIAIASDHAGAQNNLAMLRLAHGDLDAGWKGFEWRWQTPTMRGGRRDFAQPLWRGEATEGRTLLIHAEQGFGDTLQFCRYATLAAARGLRVVLEVQPALVRLLRSLPTVGQVVGQGEDLPAFDLHCPMLSMPLALGTTLATIPAALSYLHAEAGEIASWRARLSAMDKPNPKVGLVWAGSTRPTAALAALDRRRSMPPKQLAPLVAVSGLHFLSLQKGGSPAPADLALTDFMAEMDDFADTAALVANLDLVISVDTSVAHLAAALGKPVWLLDRFDSDWRWLIGRTDSPWYPTLRIYRQPKPNEWDSILVDVARDLRQVADRS